MIYDKFILVVIYLFYNQCCCCSVAKSCLTLYNSMDCNTPGFPVLHCLLEFAQIHVHWISDAINPSPHLLSLSSLALNFYQNQGNFQQVVSLHQVAKVLELQLQHKSLQMNIQDWFPLGFTGLISVLSTGLSRVFSNTTITNHQFLHAQSSLWSNSHIHTWLLEKTIALTRWTFVSKVMSLIFNILSRLIIAFLPRSKHLLK